MRVYPLTCFNASFSKIASDKSISHRFSLFSMLCAKKSVAKNYLLAEDTLNTLKIIENLGARVERKGGEVSITPPKQILSPNDILDCGNSGTAMRLLMGFLAGVEGKFFVLSGDIYLNKRPMKRLSQPLSEIGARIYGRENANLAPLAIVGARLKSFDYQSKIASAQVKTALILAGFKADKKSFYTEFELSRNHSENMLLFMNAPLKVLKSDKKGAQKLEISPLKTPLKPLNITIPNDPSSSFYFALAAVLLPNSKVVLKNVLLNETRIEAFKILQKMGAKIEFKIKQNS